MTIYLIIAALIILSEVTMGKGRVKDIEERGWEQGEYEAYKINRALMMPFGYFIPLVLASLLEIAVVLIYGSECHIVLDADTPSYSESWIWTSVVAYLLPIPLGFQLFLTCAIYNKMMPESDFVRYMLIALSAVGFGCGVWVMMNIYSIWFIWIPILTYGVLARFCLPHTHREKDIIEEDRKRNNAATTTTTSTTYTPSTTRSSGSSYAYGRSSSASSSGSSSSSSYGQSDSQRAAALQRADGYLYSARQYEDEARRFESEADSYIRSAEDNEYWARESNDSFKRSEAQNDRNRASSLRRQASQARSQASRYYSLYQEELRKAR